MIDEEKPTPDPDQGGDRDEPDGAADDDPKAKKTKKRGSFWRELPLLLVVAVVVALLVRTFVLQTFWIPSGSMENTLEISDRVLVNKLVYRFGDPSRGEVVVFEAPPHWRSDPDEKEFIKRIIAVGGDHVVCCDAQDRITVNGYPLDESDYIFTDPDTGQQNPPSRDEFEITVPDGRLWVMGDHRSASGDSREQWIQTHNVEASTIDVDAVVGKAFLLIWPIGRWDWLSTPDTFDNVPDPS